MMAFPVLSMYPHFPSWTMGKRCGELFGAEGVSCARREANSSKTTKRAAQRERLFNECSRSIGSKLTNEIFQHPQALAQAGAFSSPIMILDRGWVLARHCIFISDSR